MKFLKQFESFNSSVKELSWTQWDEVMTYMNERFDPTEITQMLEVIEESEKKTRTKFVQNFGKVITPRIFNIRQYKMVPESREFPDGRMIFKNIELYKKLKGEDPDWFYIHLENYETQTGNYYECDTFEDFIEKLESILLIRD